MVLRPPWLLAPAFRACLLFMCLPKHLALPSLWPIYLPSPSPASLCLRLIQLLSFSPSSFATVLLFHPLCYVTFVSIFLSVARPKFVCMSLFLCAGIALGVCTVAQSSKYTQENYRDIDSTFSLLSCWSHHFSFAIHLLFCLSVAKRYWATDRIGW